MAPNTHFYRALKKWTGGIARKVVNAVNGENGFLAWRMLHLEYEPGLAAQKGRVLAEVTMMAAKTSKSPEETRKAQTSFGKPKKA